MARERATRGLASSTTGALNTPAGFTGTIWIVTGCAVGRQRDKIWLCHQTPEQLEPIFYSTGAYTIVNEESLPY